jgi:hypothetical protein
MEAQDTQLAAEPPGLALYRISVGHYFSRALALVAKLGIPDLLEDGPRHYEDLAKAAATHGPSLKRVMRLLASIGVFKELDNGNFALTSLGELLRTRAPGSMRSMVLLFAGTGVQDAWKELEYCVRTGEPWFRRESPDADAFTTIAANPEQARVFDEAMATLAPLTAAAIAASYDFSAFRKLVDIGGGDGSLLIGILKAYPNLNGIVFDLPHAAEKARVKISAAELQTRCEALGGDFFKGVPAGADAYILKHVMHDWNDELAGAILRNIHHAMAPHAKLLITEGVYPGNIDESDMARGSAANDVNMLVCTGGRQRSAVEFHSLLASARFKLTKIIPTPARLSVIEADRA